MSKDDYNQRKQVPEGRVESWTEAAGEGNINERSKRLSLFINRLFDLHLGPHDPNFKPKSRSKE